MNRHERLTPQDAALVNLSAAIQQVLFDDAGIERPIERESVLAAELRTSTHDVARHFLGQLSQHCNMLASALADGSEALARLEPALAFSGVVVARGMLEAAADLYWLSDRQIDRAERTRRTFLVFLRQHEAQVREIVRFSKRIPATPTDDAPDLDAAIAEGWESLRQHAKEMASAGYELRTSDRPGSKYSVGDPKPAVSRLVDKLIADHVGLTALPIYSMYSSVAHAEGGGLGSLRVMHDAVETPEGKRHLRGFDLSMWHERVVASATRGATGAFVAWARLAYPSRLGELTRQRAEERSDTETPSISD
jgi:hypothetical protein